MLLYHLAFLHCGESAGDDEEAGKKDPGREGGQEVVGAGDAVEGEEHGDVACLLGVGWRGGGVCRGGSGGDDGVCVGEGVL